MQICLILHFSLLILEKCCVHLRKAPAKFNCFFQRRIYSTNIDCFVMDSLHSHLTFVAFCLWYVILKQQLRQYNYFVVQSALLTEFRTDFMSSVWNFCHWVADFPPRKNVPVARSKEKWLFSQTSYCPWHKKIATDTIWHQGKSNMHAYVTGVRLVLSKPFTFG